MVQNSSMTTTERVLLAAAVVVLDLVLFVVPLTGFLAAYLIIARPPWFLTWVEALYDGARGPTGSP